MTGADMICELLLEQGVDTVFGYPGGAALNIYNALYQYKDRIRHILTAHEQGAAHAADGYARATGKTGVVFATSGPGATNLVTGIATAYMDSIPLVAITSNVVNDLIGRDAFQEVCITGITMPITKHNFFVNRVEDLAHTVREAFRIASTGRRGPVLIDITKDVTAAESKLPPPQPAAQPIYTATEEDIIRTSELLSDSTHPVLLIGGGAIASGAEDVIRQLMERCDLPATYTMMAAGILDPEDPRNLGMAGMHGTPAANRALSEADFILALGTRFSDRVALNREKFAKAAAIVQVDIDHSEINKNIPVDLGIVQDVRSMVEQLLPYVKPRRLERWHAKLAGWKEKYYKPSDDPDCLKPHQIMEIVSAMTDEKTIFVTDVGQHQMWAAQHLHHQHPRQFLTSGGLGTMGFGYGAAIGAQIGCPDRRVIHFTGDGSFHMNLNEACTAVSYNLPIISIIINNQVLGMVYQWQTVFYNRCFSETTPERKTDFVKLAEAFGAVGYRASTLEEFKTCLAKALQQKGPVWIECVIDREERVLPMIPNGGTFRDIILE